MTYIVFKQIPFYSMLLSKYLFFIYFLHILLLQNIDYRMSTLQHTDPKLNYIQKPVRNAHIQFN